MKKLFSCASLILDKNQFFHLKAELNSYIVEVNMKRTGGLLFITILILFSGSLGNCFAAGEDSDVTDAKAPSINAVELEKLLPTFRGSADNPVPPPNHPPSAHPAPVANRWPVFTSPVFSPGPY